MRIIATSDLHYNIARSKAPTESVAREICERGADALILVGDTIGADLSVLDEACALFEGFRGIKMAIAGNHELWTVAGDSLYRYENELREGFSRHGFHYLDAEPLVTDGVGFVGNVGWYDFSYRPAELRVPLRFYQHKVAPGAAIQLSDMKHLGALESDVPAEAREITTRWMDGVRVNLPFSDVEFTHRSVARLRRHLADIESHVDTIVASIHHLPFASLVPRSILPNWAFANAFMGSELLGETVLEFPKVRQVFCGHSHRGRKHHVNGLTCTNIGSTYTAKQYEVLDV